MAEWRPLTLGSTLNGAPSAPVPAPIIGKLQLLPFSDLSWEDFERLQWRVLRDVEGLRHAQLYGDRGQAQRGLDVVALAPDGTGVALQSKRYKNFGATELNAAVTKFRTTKRPFDVGRLIIGVSRPVRTTAAVERLATLRKELHPVGLELWDAQELSDLLRNQPAIVIEFFGQPTAEAFCLPFKIDLTLVPPADVVAVREAIARTPEVSSGAQQLFDRAASTTDPSEALSLVEGGQAKLRDAGFGPHAAQHASDRVRLLAKLDRGDEAARHVLDAFWAAMDQGLSATAQITQSQLAELAKLLPGNESVESSRRVALVAIDLYLNPLGYLPDVDKLRIGEPVDQVRLVLLGGETALANDDQRWLASAVPVLSELAETSSVDRVLLARLRILLAETTGDWVELLTDARKLNLGHGLLGLVTARYARHCALHEKFEEAELAWDDASGSASLAQQWGEASTWIFSRRAFRAHWEPFTSDELLPLQIAIHGMGTSSPLVPTAHDAYADALAALRDDSLRSAAISAQRALRDAVTTSDWVGEDRARRALAAVLIESDEPVLAARHLVRAGATKAVEALGESQRLQFIDVLEDLDAPNYWTVGTTYRLLASQADLIPDQLIGQISGHIVAELTASETGIRPDLRAFSTSRYNNAIKALAGIGDRLDTTYADAVLRHFEKQPLVEEDHYRYHDEDEAVSVARIALTHASLAQRAIIHLISLLARSQAARNTTTHLAIHENLSFGRDALFALAQQGNDWARETLSFEDPQDVDPTTAAQALTRLTTPLEHKKGVYSVGTNAVGDSLLVRHLPEEAIHTAISELLTRADAREISSSDRADYLIAAANLSPNAQEPRRSAFFDVAMQLATSPTPSQHDELEQRFTHKLGGFRINGGLRDSRAEAMFLASALATDENQQNEVRRFVYTQLGQGSDYWPSRALQRLGDMVNDDLAFLASQGSALRSLAATRWARHGEPSHVGRRLAADPDVRVRKALATALAEQPETSHLAVRAQLAGDPAYSVRTALLGSSLLPKASDTPS